MIHSIPKSDEFGAPFARRAKNEASKEARSKRWLYGLTSIYLCCSQDFYSKNPVELVYLSLLTPSHADSFTIEISEFVRVFVIEKREQVRKVAYKLRQFVVQGAKAGL
ncbi:hypothetical protein KFK09_012086 [Dendrobium nobile]|uniref:Uncharacterized protein n=1 Tax=Dendrobium nobile TaxID=94219 RepID=A0A8T3BEL2_DENNO|nr:hypothetical protein KFK09_012086 [Dendrobium nobile]